jgi:hypothetical protein
MLVFQQLLIFVLLLGQDFESDRDAGEYAEERNETVPVFGERIVQRLKGLRDESVILRRPNRARNRISV